TVDHIGRFTTDVRQAEAKIASCERAVDELRTELHRPLQWDIDHRFPDSRLRTVDAELAELSPSPQPRLSWEDSLLTRAPELNQAPWLDVARPPLPGHDHGAGIDLGL